MAQKALENWDRLFQLFLGRPNGIVTKSTYLRLDGTYFALAENVEEKLLEVPAPMAEFALSLLEIEGDLECPATALTLSEDAGWVLFALADLARRTHYKSLMNGTPEANLTLDPMRVVEALEADLFPGTGDPRFLMAFLSIALGIRAKPNLKKARQDLIAADFLGKDGNMTREGGLLCSTFTQTQTMLGLYGYQRDRGKDKLCCGAVLNCYHSLWSIVFDGEKRAFYLTTMSRKELGKVLEDIFS